MTKKSLEWNHDKGREGVFYSFIIIFYLRMDKGVEGKSTLVTGTAEDVEGFDARDQPVWPIIAIEIPPHKDKVFWDKVDAVEVSAVVLNGDMTFNILEALLQVCQNFRDFDVHGPSTGSIQDHIPDDGADRIVLGNLVRLEGQPEFLVDNVVVGW